MAKDSHIGQRFWLLNHVFRRMTAAGPYVEKTSVNYSELVGNGDLMRTMCLFRYLMPLLLLARAQAAAPPIRWELES